MDELLEEILRECAPFTAQGTLADYIPELAKADPRSLGIYMVSSDGRISRAGDYHQYFTIQSIVKPILLLQALLDNGVDYVRSRVGVEATGKPFDAINYTEQTLLSEHINPMVNMGAIAMCTMIRGGSYAEKFERLLNLTRLLAGNDEICLAEDVYLSEKKSGNKTYGMIQDDVEEVLDCYFRACSIRVDCADLAHIGFVLANHGRQPMTGERIFPSEYASYVNAILMTCGMYDGSGDFAVKVGVPAKSGVGGGIMAVVPTRMGIGIFSPALDEKGNSIAGIRALEILSKRLYLSIF